MSISGIHSYLLCLLRNELWGTPIDKPQLTEKKYAALLEEAKRQAVLGLAAQAIVNNDLPVGTINTVKAIDGLQQIEKRNSLVSKELKRFVEKIEETGKDYVIVKGQTIGILYPHPGVRSPGDVDFFFPDKHYQENRKLLKRLFNANLPGEAPHKEVGFDIGDIHFELHQNLALLSNPLHNRRWGKFLKAAVEDDYYVRIEGMKVKTLSPTTNVVYTFYHLFNHFVKEGIGIRQLVDLAVMLYAYHEETDKGKLERMLRKLGLYRVFKTFGSILIDYIGLGETYFPFILEEKDRKKEDIILEDILYKGNFARSVRENDQAGMKYKMETFRLMLHQCLNYYSLAPSELFFFMPRRLNGDLCVLRNKIVSLFRNHEE